MSIESADDLDEFFDTDDFATPAAVAGPNDFTKTINVILDLAGEETGAYGDSIIDTVEPSFLAKSIDIADVKKGYAVTFPELEPHEDGYGKTYKVEKFRKDEAHTTRVVLKTQ